MNWFLLLPFCVLSSCLRHKCVFPNILVSRSVLFPKLKYPISQIDSESRPSLSRLRKSYLYSSKILNGSSVMDGHYAITCLEQRKDWIYVNVHVKCYSFPSAEAKKTWNGKKWSYLKLK